MRDVNYEGFLRADLEKFRGLYIAIVNGQVVEAGEEPEKIYVKAREKYPKKRLSYGRFPEKRRSYYNFQV